MYFSQGGELHNPDVGQQVELLFLVDVHQGHGCVERVVVKSSGATKAASPLSLER